MGKLVWTAENLKDIGQLDYLWHVLENIGSDTEAVVFFGTTGGGHSPHYMIERCSGDQETYNGINHDPYRDTDSFDRENLSDQGFDISTLRTVLDHQSKSREAALALMSEYWKDNNHLFPASKIMSEHRDQLIAWSTAGTPIAKAFELALGSSEGQ